MEQARNKVTDYDTNRNTKYQRLYRKLFIQDTIQSVPTVDKVKFVQSVTFSSKYLMIRELLCSTTKKMFKNLNNNFNEEQKVNMRNRKVNILVALISFHVGSKLTGTDPVQKILYEQINFWI
jgi:hypothetical protein